MYLYCTVVYCIHITFLDICIQLSCFLNSVSMELIILNKCCLLILKPRESLKKVSCMCPRGTNLKCPFVTQEACRLGHIVFKSCENHILPKKALTLLS